MATESGRTETTSGFHRGSETRGHNAPLGRDRLTLPQPQI
jgi:hypothetical protein